MVRLGLGEPPPSLPRGQHDDIYWESIDPVTGAITGKSDSLYHGGYSFYPPVRVSRDGARVLVGLATSMPAPGSRSWMRWAFQPKDALWLADGGLITIRPGRAGFTLLEHWDAELRRDDLAEYPGDPAARGGAAG